MASELVAIETFHPAGHPTVNSGDILSADDPVVRGREHLFRSVEEQVVQRVERATAAPGEVRNVTRSKKTRSKAKADSDDDGEE